MLVLSRPKFSSPDATTCFSPPLAFIFGSPRSGTTWLGKLLDSHRGVLYLHEPIHKGQGQLLHQAIGVWRRDQLLPTEWAAPIVSELIENSARYNQPPFFPKDFVRFPTAAVAAWAWQRITGRSMGPAISLSDLGRIRLLVIKEGIAWFARPLTEYFEARSVLLLRHPCGAVNSMLRGQQIGAMDTISRDRYWHLQAAALERLGYEEADVRRLANDEFEALRWLVDNQDVPQLATNDRYKLVIYDHLVLRMLDIMEDIFSWLGLGFSPESRNYALSGERLLSERLRWLLGSKKRYYAVTARSARPDIAWEKELSPASISRIRNIVSPFPLARFWPELD